MTSIELSTNNIGDAGLRSLCDGIAANPLCALRALKVGGNRLTCLPTSFADGVVGRLQVFECADNSWSNPPQEVMHKGLETIRDFLRKLSKGAVKCYQAKLCLLGRAEVRPFVADHLLCTALAGCGSDSTAACNLLSRRSLTPGRQNQLVEGPSVRRRQVGAAESCERSHYRN